MAFLTHHDRPLDSPTMTDPLRFFAKCQAASSPVSGMRSLLAGAGLLLCSLQGANGFAYLMVDRCGTSLNPGTRIMGAPVAATGESVTVRSSALPHFVRHAAPSHVYSLQGWLMSIVRMLVWPACSRCDNMRRAPHSHRYLMSKLCPSGSSARVRREASARLVHDGCTGRLLCAPAKLWPSLPRLLMTHNPRLLMTHGH